MVVPPGCLCATKRPAPGDAAPPTGGRCSRPDARELQQDKPLWPGRRAKRKRGNRQRRYVEHPIRDAEDLERPVAYLHFNPVKHGWAQRPVDWPPPTLHACIARGMAAPHCGVGAMDDGGDYGER